MARTTKHGQQGPLVAWQIQALARINWLNAEVNKAAQHHGGSINPNDRTFKRATGEPRVSDKAFDEILSHLKTAEEYLTRSPSFLRWLRGTRVEGAWINIHAAHARLLEVAGNQQMSGLRTDVQSAVAAYLPEGHAWRKEVDAWSRRDLNAAEPAFSDYDRELLSHVLSEAYGANAEGYTQLRRFRNILLGSALLFGILAVSVSLVTALRPSLIPMCFPETEAADGGRSEADDATGACPTGAQEPTGGDIGLVAALGLLGGAIGGTPSLTRSTGATVSAYTLRVARTLLKITLGAVTAVLGLLFLRAGFVPGFSPLDSQAEILGYAVVFGSSQQLLTRLADQQAERVLQTASSEENG